MVFTQIEKEQLKRKIVECLESQNEIEKIIIFGSFLESDSPNDLDLAIFQRSKENYLTLALRYRKIVREISKRISVEIIPLHADKSNDFLTDEIETGEVIYERGN